jgi:hypothetical protein
MRALLLLVPSALALVAAAPAQRPGRDDDGRALALLLQRYDADKDGKVQRGEYPRAAAAFANLDRDKNGAIDAWRKVAATLREPEPLAKRGELAPDFELPMLGMKGKTVKLSSFRGERPVALVFGSYT